MNEWNRFRNEAIFLEKAQFSMGEFSYNTQMLGNWTFNIFQSGQNGSEK